ncbi:hypothetical protein GF336_04740 [Candidatus Woesearchaeota archaeon]|nr:hypothetical protein [Candidatus Woesearchaeota archaeon]
MVTLPKGMLDEKAFQLLKGASSYYFFKKHPKARLRYPRHNIYNMYFNTMFICSFFFIF